MACKKCGSEWVTLLGSDSESCPHCCKQQRCKAKKEGRWVEPTQQKACEECGAGFTAVGLHDIATQVLCENPACTSARNKRNRLASAKRRAAGIYTLSREPKPKRYCQFSGCGNELTRRDQKGYCGKPCYFAAIDAGEQQFKGRVRDVWAGLVDWAYEWESQRKRATVAKAAVHCLVCQKPTADASHKFCSRSCMKSWRGDSRCQKCCGVIANAHWCTTVCDSCRKMGKLASRKANRSKFRSRAKKFGVAYTPIKRLDVYRRDGWRCQLCGKMCKRRWIVSRVSGVPHPRCPTIDHIVPMSRGGGHVMHNVQLSCWQCNIRKGSRLIGQRLLPMT